MISGMYLGEIVRLVLMKLTEKKLLFKGEASEALHTPGTFETKFISMIEEPDSGLENAKKILTELGLRWDLVDARVVRLVCETISSRSARLCAAALATIANRILANRGLPHLKTTVGVDGTVYKKHPNPIMSDFRPLISSNFWMDFPQVLAGYMVRRKFCNLI
ncbi:glucokinase-like isoform X2 [Poecilia latipinna]|uniref:glucokinase-like isoform X2 n=1 Tax=Poecilia latipinna TaxID=48699 RepID=UPI00072EADC4|nr:PREDICTED: glucokinase-like isoform X2 [Poecilia latipinna]